MMSVSTILLYIVSFIYIYNIPFAHSPLSGSKLMIGFMIIWLIARSKNVVVSKNMLKPIACMVALLIYSMFDVLCQRTGDMGLIYPEILFILNHVSGCLLLINIMQSMGRSTIEDVMHLIVVISFSQAIIIILSMLIPAINDLVSNIAYIEGRDFLQDRYGYARGYGLAASVTYDLAVCQAFAIMFVPYLIPTTKERRTKLFYGFASIPILFSILTLGRTGLVGVGLALVYIIKMNAKSLSRILKSLLYIATILLMGGAFFLVNSETSIVTSLKTYVFEGFDTLLSTGKLTTHTGTNLMNMWNKTKNFTVGTWIWGDGRYTDGIYYYMRTDIGFMRDVLYFGLLGCVLLLIEYVLIYRMTVGNCKNRQLRFLIRLVYIFLMVAQFKGEFLLSCGTGICMLLLLAFSMNCREQGKIKNIRGSNEQSFDKCSHGSI